MGVLDGGVEFWVVGYGCFEGWIKELKKSYLKKIKRIGKKRKEKNWERTF